MADARVMAAARALAERDGQGWVFDPPGKEYRSGDAPEVWIRMAETALNAADAVSINP